MNVLGIDIWNWFISHNINLGISHVADCLNVEADELFWGLNLSEELEWALEMDILQEIVCRFGKLDIDLFASRLNHKLEKYISLRPHSSAKVVDAFSISWTKQYVYIFFTFQHPQYGFTEDCGRRCGSISNSTLMDNSKLVATTGSSDCGFSHKTSSLYRAA